MTENLHTNLTSKVIKGSRWMITARVLTKAVGTGVIVILARILSPDDFGLIAVGLISVNFLKVFTEVGIKQSLIKESSENTEKFLNTAWTVELIRGILIFILVFISAPLIAKFFNQLDAIIIIRVLALVPLLNGLTNIKIIYLQKELEFNKQFIYEISSIIGPLLISIPLAFILQNVWAIVFGTLASEIIRVAISYYLLSFIPKFELNTGYFKQMFSFGKWIYVSTIVSYFAMELDTYFAAKFFDARLLGIYVLAFSISTAPIIEVGKALTKVFFPAFAKMNNDIDRVKKAFLKSSTVLYLILVPLSVGLFLIAESFVTIFLGEKWIEMITPLKILTLATLFRSLRVVSGAIFNGIGKPELIFTLSLLRIVTLVLFFIFFLLYSSITLVTISISVLFSSLLTSIFFYYLLYKYLNININDLYKNYFPIILGGLLMFLSILITDNINLLEYFKFIIILFLASLFYLLAIFLFRKNIDAIQIIKFRNILK